MIGGKARDDKLVHVILHNRGKAYPRKKVSRLALRDLNLH